jgi:hypothetical protein
MITMRNATMKLVLVAMVTAMPLAAQMPAGWMMRFDRRNATETDAKFVTMASGFHVTTTAVGAAVFYNPKDMGSGQYSVAATFKAAKSMSHESYGIFIGGRNLQDSTQNYLYLVIRPLDGHFAIGHRDSNGRPVYLAAITDPANPAINLDSPTDGSSTNTVMIHVAADTVHFIVNGKVVKALAKSQLGNAMTDGQAGIRINHVTDIHIDSWTGISKK